MQELSPLPRRVWPALAASLLLAAAALWLIWLRSEAAALPALAQMPDFRLTDQTGQPLTAEGVRGKVLLVGFIYTECDDICPTLTAQMRGLQEDLARAGFLGRAELLSISVDPERDTPERLAEYARRHGADTSSWRFLTGDAGHVRQVVVEGFLLGLQRVPAHGGHESHGGDAPADYRVEHSGRIALVDRSGQVHAYYDGLSLDNRAVVAQVGSLLKER